MRNKKAHRAAAPRHRLATRKPTPVDEMLRYSSIILVLAVCGCASTRRADSPADDVTWIKLVETVSQLQASQADQGAAFEKAQKELGLEKYGGREGAAVLFVAHGKRNAVQTHPWPRVGFGAGANCGGAGNQNLVCAGDLYGDGKTEYVLGCGWSGPMGGAVCIYDEALRKIAEVSLDDVFALQLEDLTGDGGLEILVWQDRHNGEDAWRRYLQIFRLSQSRGLKTVWEGATYSISDLGGTYVTKSKIRIRRKGGKPAVIETKEIYSRGTTEDADNGTSHSYSKTPCAITRYEWNPVSETFEE